MAAEVENEEDSRKSSCGSVSAFSENMEEDVTGKVGFLSFEVILRRLANTLTEGARNGSSQSSFSNQTPTKEWIANREYT